LYDIKMVYVVPTQLYWWR